MAQVMTLEARERTDLGSANCRRIRRLGYVPGILYGKKKGNRNFVFAGPDVAHALKNAKIVEIKLPEGGEESAVVKEVQYDEITDRILHVDFGRVSLDEYIEVEVGLRCTGESVGEKAGGHLEQPLRSVRVRCQAGSIPDEILVDITNLGLNEALRVADLELGQATTAVTDAGAVIVACKPTVEVEETPADEPVQSEPEVLSKGKKDKDEEA